MVASPTFSEPKHRLNCFQNKSENSQNPIALVQDYYKIGILVIQRPNPGEACFYCIFRDLRRFYFLNFQKLKYAAAYFAYTQARPCLGLLDWTIIGCTCPRGRSRISGEWVQML